MSNPKFIVLNDYVIINNKLVPKRTASIEKLPSGVINKLLTKDVIEAPASPSLFEEEFGEGEQLQEEINEDQEYMWEDSTTLVLLDEYRNHLQEFRNPKIKKKVLWNKIAKSLREKNYANVDGAYLDKKFRNMKNTFKKIKDNNKKPVTGRGRVNWKYYDRFEEIFATDKTINPPKLVSTIAMDNEPGTSATENTNPVGTPSSSRSSTPEGNAKSHTRLDAFRKRQLELEEARLDELKAIRLEIAQSNKINQEKLELLKQHLNSCHNNK